MLKFFCVEVSRDTIFQDQLSTLSDRLTVKFATAFVHYLKRR